MNTPQVASTVYIVDDDEAVRDSLRWLLEANGYRVRAYASAEAFLSEFDEHQPGVLIWNLFFLIQNNMLFLRTSSSQPFHPDNSISSSIQIGNRIARFLVITVILWPSLESFGFCDHWPAWAVYAAKPERVTVTVHSDELPNLPEHLSQYLGHQLVIDDSHPLRIDRWSLDALYVPIYPQDRFQVGVALYLARRFDLKQIQVVIEGPADRWSGKRAVHRYNGIESLNTLADSYRCNAQPKMRQF